MKNHFKDVVCFFEYFDKEYIWNITDKNNYTIVLSFNK